MSKPKDLFDVHAFAEIGGEQDVSDTVNLTIDQNVVGATISINWEPLERRWALKFPSGQWLYLHAPFQPQGVVDTPVIVTPEPVPVT